MVDGKLARKIQFRVGGSSMHDDLIDRLEDRENDIIKDAKSIHVQCAVLRLPDSDTEFDYFCETDDPRAVQNLEMAGYERVPFEKQVDMSERIGQLRKRGSRRGRRRR